jgi:hypothetical protein
MDLADLLGDNSSNNREKRKRSDFLSALQKSRTSTVIEGTKNQNQTSTINSVDEVNFKKF